MPQKRAKYTYHLYIIIYVFNDNMSFYGGHYRLSVAQVSVLGVVVLGCLMSDKFQL